MGTLRNLGSLCLLLFAVANSLGNHVHLQVAWRQGALVLEIFDFEQGAYPSDAFPFVIGNTGMGVIPSTSEFAFLGDAGATFFYLPQEEKPGLPFLGIGVDNVPGGTFIGNQVNLRLMAVNGPGHFMMYQVNGLGTPTLRMSSRDGITSTSDRVSLSPGAHEHQSWAFTAPGNYEVVFVADAVRQSTGQTITSAATTYRFRVLSPPAVRLEVSRSAGSTTTVDLLAHSRVGARLQLLESTDLTTWTTNTTQLLTTPTWNTVVPIPSNRSFWRVDEVFP